MLLLCLLAAAQDAFETGARAQTRSGVHLTVEAAQMARFARLARSGYERAFARQGTAWFPYVIEGLLDDDERIAVASARALRQLCFQHRLADPDGRNPVQPERLRSAGYRAWLYDLAARWYLGNQEVLEAAARNAPRPVRWNEIVDALKAGGGWDDPGRPEGRAYATLQSFGVAGLTPLVGYVDADDLGSARAAVKALNQLTGRQTPLPTETTREALQGDWKAWFQNQGFPVDAETRNLVGILVDVSSDADVLAQLRRLAEGTIEERATAPSALRRSLLRHEALFQRTFEGADTPELRVALGSLLDEVPDLKRRALELRADGEALRVALIRLRSRHPDPAAFGRAVERLLASLQDVWTEWRDVPHRRREIAKACALDLPGRARWGDARAAWEFFAMEVDPPLDLKEAIDKEALALDEEALKDVETVRREALRRLGEGRREDVAGYLKGQRVRFESTAAEARLAAIEELLAP